MDTQIIKQKKTLLPHVKPITPIRRPRLRQGLIRRASPAIPSRLSPHSLDSIRSSDFVAGMDPPRAVGSLASLVG